MLKYLLDEHIPLTYRAQILRRAEILFSAAVMEVWAIGDPDAPPKGTPDPDILLWCDSHDFVLVTNNRRSMPNHLADHLAAGHHMPGIFTIGADLNIGQLIDELILIAFAALDGEFTDRITFLPIT
ncbi:MAG: hypothetical protein ACKVX9_19775 [Blastocatellia bacterium]